MINVVVAPLFIATPIVVGFSVWCWVCGWVWCIGRVGGCAGGRVVGWVDNAQEANVSVSSTVSMNSLVLFLVLLRWSAHSMNCLKN